MSAYLPARIVVEGRDDLYALKNLLKQYDIEISEQRSQQVPWITSAGGREELLKSMGDQVRAQAGGIVGFVLDADADESTTWQAARERLKRVGADAPNVSHQEGLLYFASRYAVRVGIWMMPDNSGPGALEDFLAALIPGDQGLFRYAQSCAAIARRNFGAPFSDSALSKAELSTWLAWQKRPGVPYGTAITAKYFDAGSPAAQRFVNWFEELVDTS